MTQKEVASVLRRHKEWVGNRHVGKRADLRGASLRNMRLEGADFRYADCRACDFSGSNLAGAVFQGADCRGANFNGASCVGTNFVNARLDAANMRSVDLRLAVMDYAQMTGVNLNKGYGAHLDGYAERTGKAPANGKDHERGR